MAKHRYVTISDLCFHDWISAQFKVGFDSGKYPYKVVGGLPEDAKLVDIKLLDVPMRMILCVFYSDSFEDVEDIYSLQPISIVVSRYEVKDGIQTKN